MAVKYLRLFDPTQQFLLKNGALNVAGLLKVKLEGTDDWAPVFDEDGTQLQQPVILDNNGRSGGLFVDASKVYWLEVDDRDGYELFTIRKMSPCGGGSGSTLGTQYEVQSTDGTVKIDRYTSDGVVYFDLSTDITDEAATWGATFGSVNAVSGDDDWAPVPVVSEAGSSVWNDGWTAKKDCVADIAASLEMSGDSSANSTIDVMCVFSVDGNAVSTEYSQLDPTEAKGKVSFEYKGEVSVGQVVDCRIFVKSVEAMSPALSAKVYFNEECDGIVGGGSSGNNYFPGEYVDISTANVISVTGVQPVSGMSSYVTQSAFDSCCSSMSGYVSSLSSDVSALSAEISGITGATGDYVEKSAISGVSAIWNEASGVSSKLDQSASGEFYSTSNPSGFITGVDLSDYATTAYVDSSVSGKADQSALTGKLDNSASSLWYPMTGNPSGFLTEHQELSGYVEKSAISAQSSIWDEASGMSGKLDNSASSTFYPMTGNPSGFLTEHQDLSGYVEKSAISAQSSEWNEISSLSSYVEKSAISAQSSQWNDVSGLSGKLDNSASSLWYPMTGNPSGFLTAHQDLSDYVPVSAISAESSTWNSASAISAVIPWSALEGTGSTITAISGSAVGSTSVGKVYSGIDPIVVDNTADTISVNHSGLTVDETMTAYTSGTNIVIGVNSSVLELKLDRSASSEFYSTANPSGFITGIDLSNYATTGYVDSSISGKLDSSASSSFYPVDNPSGFITGVDLSNYATTGYVDSSVSGKLDTTAFNSGDFYSTANPSGFITGVDLSPYQLTADMSGYIPTSESANYQQSSAMTAYQLSGDYAYNSALSGYIPTSESANYQPVSAMTAYQPSGDYIYASALGTGEI